MMVFTRTLSACCSSVRTPFLTPSLLSSAVRRNVLLFRSFYTSDSSLLKRNQFQSLHHCLVSPTTIRQHSLSPSSPLQSSAIVRCISSSSSSSDSDSSSSNSSSASSKSSSSSSSSSASVGSSWYNRVSLSDRVSELRYQYESNRPRLRYYMIVGAGILAAFLVFDAGLGIVEFFAELNFLEVGEAAFIAGMITMAGLHLTGWLMYKRLALRPEAIYPLVLRRVTNEPTIKSLLGSSIKPSHFRSYSYVKGYLRSPSGAAQVELSDNDKRGYILPWLRKYYQPRRLQIFIQIDGVGDSALVTAEVQKQFFATQPTFNSLAVEMLGGNQQIILEGDEDSVVEHPFLRTLRKRHIKQKGEKTKDN